MKNFAPRLPISSSFVLAAALACQLGWSADARADEVVITDKARTHFRAGVSLLQDPDGARYAEAYREFRIAYAESPSWKILGNLGISAMKLERDGEAIQAFELYLKEGGDQLDPADKAQFTRDLETLKAGVTWVTIQSNPPGATVLDSRVPLSGRPTENRYDALAEPTRIGVRAGQHRMTVELDGYEPSTWVFEASGGEVAHTFELVKKTSAVTPTTGGADSGPEKTYERPVPTSVWVGLAATGAFTVGATVTGILALGKKSDFDASNSVTDREALKSDGQTMNAMTDIFLGGALIAAGTTAYFYFTRPSVEVTPEKDAAFRVTPTMLPGGGGVWMQGSF